ncbi:MAG: FkbM family methyltransferase [Leptolyngbyaceae cyanobacterium SM2_5_2]|nr:FkbM family methyltransferase [Leptolyngbyaceae cyanobacterium SM2_5_2]
MRVEACCQALLQYLLPELDPHRQGLCVDVGVGTFAFYCELFAQLGFTTVAVEPAPTEQLRAISQRHGIQLLELCLSDQVGTQTLHLGQFASVANANFSSLSADWFGASGRTQTVPTLDLAGLLERVQASQITAFKLDIEGWEPVVIKQFSALPDALLPEIVMFEYGGGSSYAQRQSGWSPQFLAGTLDCLKTLQQRGYNFSIMIDYAPGSRPKVFDLQKLNLAEETPFYSNGVYGNILSLRHHRYSEAHIQTLCAPYRGGLINWLVGNLVLYASSRGRSS